MPEISAGTSSLTKEYLDAVQVDEKPCCAAEALRRIKQVNIGSVVVGIAMLDAILAEVTAMKLSGKGR